MFLLCESKEIGKIKLSSLSATKTIKKQIQFAIVELIEKWPLKACEA